MRIFSFAKVTQEVQMLKHQEMISGKSKDIFEFVSPFSIEIKCTQNVLQICPIFSMIYYLLTNGTISRVATTTKNRNTRRWFLISEFVSSISIEIKCMQKRDGNVGKPETSVETNIPINLICGYF